MDASKKIVVAIFASAFVTSAINILKNWFDILIFICMVAYVYFIIDTYDEQ